MYILKGRFLGIKRVSNTNKKTGEIRERVTAGIETSTPNEFGSTDVQTHEVGIPPFLVKDGKFMDSLAAAKDKMGFFGVAVRVWQKDEGYTLMTDLTRHFELIGK